MTDDPIVSTRDHPGDYDGLVSAKPGEPLFHLQGGDPFAPTVILKWAELARAAGLAEPDKAKADSLLRKATNAEQVAWRMQAYQAGHVDQEGQRAKYADDGPPVEVITDERAARIKVAAKVTGLAADAQAAVDQLVAVHHDGPGTAALRNAVEELTDAGRLIEPRTGRERT